MSNNASENFETTTRFLIISKKKKILVHMYLFYYVYMGFQSISYWINIYVYIDY